MNSTGTPASSNVAAVYWSYVVSMTHLWPCSFHCCRWWVRTRRIAGSVVGPVAAVPTDVADADGPPP